MFIYLYKQYMKTYSFIICINYQKLPVLCWLPKFDAPPRCRHCTSPNTNTAKWISSFPFCRRRFPPISRTIDRCSCPLRSNRRPRPGRIRAAPLRPFFDHDNDSRAPAKQPQNNYKSIQLGSDNNKIRRLN